MTIQIPYKYNILVNIKIVSFHFVGRKSRCLQNIFFEKNPEKRSTFDQI